MISNALEVILARKLVQSALEKYGEKNDAESHEMLQARIDDLQQIYLTIQERELNNIVLKVELANTQNKITGN